LALGACGAPSNEATKRDDGVYGSSSGPNPNLADLQQDNPATSTANPNEAPASPQEQAYPSQAAQPPPPTDPGRGSAETGATEGQN
jgi:hypothetical protein